MSEKQGTKIFALGGLEEIGKNTYVIETKKTIIVVDAGIKFANAQLLGFDSMIANYDYLKQNEHKIGALLITHGHEDHIGAIPFFLKHIKVNKIIASNLTTQLIIKKCSEHKDIRLPEIITYFDNDVVEVEDVKMEFFGVCHSIPDSYGVAFETPDGRILSTGDFRFDFATESQRTDLNKVVEIGAKGVDVLLCESTSVEVEGFSDSERKIIANLQEFISKAEGRVFLSTFASNLARLEQVIKFAKTINKKILLVGRSMETNIKISRKLGYLKLSDIDFISSKELNNYEDKEVLILLTGSQGEEQAALNNILAGRHARLSFKPSDTVILSSNPIPGNFAAVEEMINKLYRVGVNVIENHPDKKIHASGHATRGELQLMIKAVNPTYLFPIHGEYKMLKMMKLNAETIGMEEDKILIAKNGQVIRLNKHEATLTDEIIDTSPIFINGTELNNKAAELLKVREVLSKDGFVFIMIKYNAVKKYVISVTLSTRGSFFAKDAAFIVAKINAKIKDDINKYIKEQGWNMAEFEKIAKSVSNEFIWKFKKKNPYTEVYFMDVCEIQKQIDNKEFFSIKDKPDETMDDLDLDDDQLLMDEDDMLCIDDEDERMD